MKKYNGTAWVDTALRQYKTATEAVESPLYSDGTAITSYTIKGNTVQNGTPTPSNPVDVNGVGVKTENLVESYLSGCNIGSTGVLISNGAYNMFLAKVEQGKTYCLDSGATVGGYYTDIPTVGSTSYNEQRLTFDLTPFTAPIDGYLAYRKSSSETTAMMNEGNELKPYEPYGYKIPISNGQTTTPIYLGSTSSTRQIKKLVFDGTENNWRITGTGRMAIPLIDLPLRLRIPYCTHFIGTNAETYSNVGNGECSISVVNGSVREFGCYDSTIATLADFKTWLQQQYANGTPLTIWYILATLETGAVNEPLMKIGDYADTLSNAASIPTIEGANSITVDTTVQPSEFTATWTGWHNAYVKEYEGGVGNNKFDEQYPDIKTGATYRPLYVGSGEFTCTSTCPQSQYGAQIFILAGNVSTGGSTNVNGVWSGTVRKVTAVDGYVTIAYRNIGGVSPSDYKTMLNEGSTALPYEPYEYGWE